jgi:hypothetical protein
MVLGAAGGVTEAPGLSLYLEALVSSNDKLFVLLRKAADLKWAYPMLSLD